MIRHSIFASALLSLVACGGGAGLEASDHQGATSDPASGERSASGERTAAASDASPGESHAPGESARDGARDEEGSTEGSTVGSAGASQIDRGDDVLEPGLPITTQDWMSRTPGLADRPLNQITFPGSHDSGTYGLISVYQRPVGDLFAPDATAAMVKAGQFVHIVDLWAKSQDKTIAEQLEDGIRAIDLRPCREKNGTLRTCHGLYGPTMLDELQQVKAFADAHPKELVIVEMDGFNGMGDDDHLKLAAITKTTLGARLVDCSKGDVTPTMTLGELWAAHPGQNVLVGYRTDSGDPMFLHEGSFTSSWKGNIWRRAEKKQSLLDAFASDPGDTFFDFSGPATEDATLIEYGMDPLGNYPSTLEGLASETNPVTLKWVTSEWQSKRLNLLFLDFYDQTCLVKLALQRNGAPGVSLAGCNIGETTWGSWALTPYGRGAGSPMGCGAGEEQIAGLCYPNCAAGYESSFFFPTVCSEPCPSGYRNDGLTCFRDAKIISADTSECPWYNKCGLGSDCSTCPSGYHNDGCTCRRDAHAFVKDRYDRGVGKPLHTCDAGEEKDGLLCYPDCRKGYDGVGPMCWPE